MPRSDFHSNYDRARDAFDELDAEGQVRFLAETTVAAVSRGAKRISRALADELDAFFGGASSRSRPRDAEKGGGRPGPAEPPTSAQRPGG